MRPIRIVLTGGPAGGKTTFCQMAKAILPFTVRSVPEAATAIKGAAPSDGARPRSGDSGFQLAVMRSQLATEDALDDMLSSDDGCVTAILFDRGAFDSAGFVEPAEYTKLLRALGLRPLEILLRYDAIVFVRSCIPALGASAARARWENKAPSHVVAVESKLWRAVRAHSNVVVVDPFPDFAAKCAAVARGVLRAVELAQVRTGPTLVRRPLRREI